MYCGQGGGKEGGANIPYKNEIGQMMFGSLANRMLRSEPMMQGAFNRTSQSSGVQAGTQNPPGSSKLGDAYRNIFGDIKPQAYEGFGKVPDLGIYSQAVSRAFAPNQSTQSKGMYKGAGQYSSIPTGQQTPAYNPSQYQPWNISTPETSKIPALSVNPQQFDLQKQIGLETIGQSSKQAQQNLMRQMGARGIGQSGLAARASADLYNRGAGLQASQLGRDLASQKMGLEFGEAQQARGLESQRQESQASRAMQSQQMELEQRYKMAGLSADEAKTRADLEMRNRGQNLATATGLGQLGLGERAQGLSELQAQRQWEDAPLSALTGLASNYASANMGGKGK